MKEKKMHQLKIWLEDNGFSVKQTVLQFSEHVTPCICIDNNYEGPYPGKEQFDCLNRIRRHVARQYPSLRVEPRGHYTSIFIYEAVKGIA